MATVRFFGKGEGLTRYLTGIILATRYSLEKDAYSKDNPVCMEIFVKAEFNAQEDLELVFFIKTTHTINGVKISDSMVDEEIFRMPFPPYPWPRTDALRRILKIIQLDHPKFSPHNTLQIH